MEGINEREYKTQEHVITALFIDNKKIYLLYILGSLIQIRYFQ